MPGLKLCRHTGSEQAVESSTRIIRDSMIQKAKDAEPVSPAQHLLFEFLWVRYSKRAYVSHEKLKIIIIETCVSAHVVEETKVFEIVINFKIIVVPSFLGAGSTCLFSF